MACDLKPAFLLAAFCAAAAPALANELVCEPAGFPIVIDVGHSPERPGATSATGQPEFEFNLSLAEVISEPENLLIWPGFWGVTGGFTG
jgi:hypothetical protein